MPVEEIQNIATGAGWRSNLGPLKNRLLSWWHGAEADDAAESGWVASDLAEDSEGSTEHAWSNSRIAAIEAVWGEGLMLPGGERYTRKLLAVLGLSSKKSVLEIGAGIGGTARTISRQHSLWMDAIEPVEQLAAIGQRRSATAGLAKRVPIQCVDIDSFELRSRRYHAIYSREWLFTVAEKERVLDQISLGLKQNGEILLTDLVIGKSDGPTTSNKAILRQGEEGHFWTVEQYNKALQERGFLVQHTLDITSEYLDQIHAAWSQAPTNLQSQMLNPHLCDLVVEEGELWLERWNAFERGDLAVMRLHGQLVETD